MAQVGTFTWARSRCMAKRSRAERLSAAGKRSFSKRQRQHRVVVDSGSHASQLYGEVQQDDDGSNEESDARRRTCAHPRKLSRTRDSPVKTPLVANIE